MSQAWQEIGYLSIKGSKHTIYILLCSRAILGSQNPSKGTLVLDLKVYNVVIIPLSRHLPYYVRH